MGAVLPTHRQGGSRMKAQCERDGTVFEAKIWQYPTSGLSLSREKCKEAGYMYPCLFINCPTCGRRYFRMADGTWISDCPLRILWRELPEEERVATVVRGCQTFECPVCGGTVIRDVRVTFVGHRATKVAAVEDYVCCVCGFHPENVGGNVLGIKEVANGS